MTQQRTIADVSQAIQTYYKLQQEIQRLEMTRQLIKETITQSFREMGHPEYFDTNDRLRCRLQVKARESINVEEARSLLPQNLFDKLLKVTSYAQINVRRLRGE